MDDGAATSVEDLPTAKSAATTAEAAKDLVRAVDELGFNHEVSRVRYQPDFPVRGRIYEGDEWSSESSDDDDDPVWLSILAQLPPWIRNLGGGDGVSEEGGMPRRLLASSGTGQALGASRRALPGAT